MHLHPLPRDHLERPRAVGGRGVVAGEARAGHHAPAVVQGAAAAHALVRGRVGDVVAARGVGSHQPQLQPEAVAAGADGGGQGVAA